MTFDMSAVTTETVALALLIALAVVMGLYFARGPMQALIRAGAASVHHALRMAAMGVAKTRAQLVARNREVLLAQGREQAERMVEREFERIEGAVRRDLSGYPAVHKKLTERVEKLEEDYAASSHTPPAPPGWVEAVAAVAKLKEQAAPVVRDVLESIHGSLKQAQATALDRYRDDFRGRHKALQAMMPEWRKVKSLTGDVKKDVDAVLDRSRAVDQHIETYEEIARKTDKAANALESSSFVQFFISGLVLLIAIGGAVINFNLIARPMSEMVGGNNMIGSFRTADIAALVIILVELSMGLFLLECFRVTRLFPVIGALPDTVRRNLAIVAFTLLFSLACVEAGLAYMREVLLQDELATSALLRGEQASMASDPQFVWITTFAQMGMGFILPFALVFVAIPLETFIHSLRVVAGWTLAALMQMTAFVLRVAATGARQLGEGLAALYDVLIFAPLWVERALSARMGSGGAETKRPEERHAAPTDAQKPAAPLRRRRGSQAEPGADPSAVPAE